MAAEPQSEMEALLAQSDSDTRVSRGDVRTGKVIATGPQGLFIDLGLKRDGVVLPAEVARLTAEGFAFSVGDLLTVVIVETEDRDGNLVVSVHQPKQQQDWTTAEQMLASGELWEGTVLGYNRGGIIVGFRDLRGFVPASHLAELPRGVPENERQSRLAQMVGKPLTVKIIEVNRSRQRLVMSQRDARKEQRRTVMEDLAEEQVLKGVVSGLRHFGAFVNLGGRVDGLIHVSELSWQRVKHPRDVLKVGQEVEVKVIKIDPASKRVGLSLKQLQPDPWSQVTERFRVGDWIEGQVTRVASFGAFVDLGGGIEGLLHSSQMGEGEIAEGQTVRVRVVSLEPGRQRIGLSLRAGGGARGRGRGKESRRPPRPEAGPPAGEDWNEADELELDDDDEGR